MIQSFNFRAGVCSNYYYDVMLTREFLSGLLCSNTLLSSLLSAGLLICTCSQLLDLHHQTPSTTTTLHITTSYHKYVSPTLTRRHKPESRHRLKRERTSSATAVPSPDAPPSNSPTNPQRTPTTRCNPSHRRCQTYADNGSYAALASPSHVRSCTTSQLQSTCLPLPCPILRRYLQLWGLCLLLSCWILIGWLLG